MTHNKTETDAGGEGEEVKIRNRSAHGSALMEDLGFRTETTEPFFHFFLWKPRPLDELSQDRLCGSFWGFALNKIMFY